MSIGASLHVGRSVYRFNSRCQELTNSFTIQLIIHMQLIVGHFKYHIFKSICIFVISFQRYTHSVYSDLFGKIPKHLKFEYDYGEQRIINTCHTPNPGPTRLADPNRFPGRETQDWNSLPDFFFFFFLKPTGTCGLWPTSYNRIKI